MPPSAIRIRSSSSNSRAKLAKSTAVKYAPDRWFILITHNLGTCIYIAENVWNLTWSIKLLYYQVLGWLDLLTLEEVVKAVLRAQLAFLLTQKPLHTRKHNRWPTSAHLLVKYAVHHSMIIYTATPFWSIAAAWEWSPGNVPHPYGLVSSPDPTTTSTWPGNETTTPPLPPGLGTRLKFRGEKLRNSWRFSPSKISRYTLRSMRCREPSRRNNR